jgi:cyclophilin family peptidyl-prolyl cis-trans isomerase
MPRTVAAVSLAAILSLPGALAEEEASTPAVRAVLELNQQFYYAGEPLRVRVSVSNDGSTDVRNPVETPLPKGFEVRPSGGAPLQAKGGAKGVEASRPATLAPGYAYSAVVDLGELYPALRSPGSFEIRWAADGVASQTVVVRVIPKYDASKDYRARVETAEGAFVIDFFGKAAPLATKAFVDMANAGFYDGLTIHKVVADQFIEAGDPQGDGSGVPPFRYPADPTTIPAVSGTVLMKPVSPSPPTNGSQFIILARPEPTWTGQATVVGQVVEGMDIVQKLSRLPSTQQTARPFYKPLKDVRIARITVFEKSDSKASERDRENR